MLCRSFVQVSTDRHEAVCFRLSEALTVIETIMSLLEDAKLPSLKDKHLDLEAARIEALAEALRGKKEEEDAQEKVVINKKSSKN